MPGVIRSVFEPLLHGVIKLIFRYFVPGVIILYCATCHRLCLRRCDKSDFFSLFVQGVIKVICTFKYISKEY